MPHKPLPDDPHTDARLLRALARKWTPPPKRPRDVKDEIHAAEEADQETSDDTLDQEICEDTEAVSLNGQDTRPACDESLPQANLKTPDIKLEEHVEEEAKIKPALDIPPSTLEEIKTGGKSLDDSHQSSLLARSLEIRSSSTQPVSAQIAMWRACNGLIKLRPSTQDGIAPRRQRLSVSLRCGNNARPVSAMLDDEEGTSSNPLEDQKCAVDQPSDTSPPAVEVEYSLAPPILSVEVELASCNATPELEVDDEDMACPGDTSVDSGYHATSKFFPEYLHPVSSPALCPLPDDPVIKDDPSSEEDLAELLFRINMPSPRAMLAGLPTGYTPDSRQTSRLQARRNSGLSRVDSVESVLWSRSTALQAELPSLKFPGSSVPVISDEKTLSSQTSSMTCFHEEGTGNHPLHQANYHYNINNSHQPFEIQPPVPENWKVHEIFSPVKNVFEELKMSSMQSLTLSGVIADYGDRRSPERMLEANSDSSSADSRQSSVLPLDTVLKY